jgi:adenosine/AMP kinase
VGGFVLVFMCVSVCVCVDLFSQHPLDAVCIENEEEKGVLGGVVDGKSEWSMGTISLVRVVGCARGSRRFCSY